MLICLSQNVLIMYFSQSLIISNNISVSAIFIFADIHFCRVRALHSSILYSHSNYTSGSLAYKIALNERAQPIQRPNKHYTLELAEKRLKTLISVILSRIHHQPGKAREYLPPRRIETHHLPTESRRRDYYTYPTKKK